MNITKHKVDKNIYISDNNNINSIGSTINRYRFEIKTISNDLNTLLHKYNSEQSLFIEKSNKHITKITEKSKQFQTNSDATKTQ